MTSDILAPVLLFIFGTAIGSFLNVVAYRIPREKSIVRPGSACPACQTPIAWHDNVPIVSYLALRGKCRRCGVRISARYPLVELLTGVVFYLVYREYGLSFGLGLNLLFSSLLIVVSFIDLDFRIIPDVLSLGGMGAGLLLSGVYSFMLWTYEPFLGSVVGIVLGGGILWAIAAGYELLRRREGMGGGDIKLLAMIGSFCGMQGSLRGLGGIFHGVEGVIFSLVAGSLAGTLVGVPLMLFKGQGASYAVPFGPFLSFGALLYVLAGSWIVQAFVGFMYGR